MQLFDDGAHLHPQLGVQVGKGLVHEQQGRLDNEGAGQRHPLLLAAGQLIGLTGGQVFDLHQFQRFLDPAFDLVLGHLFGFQTVGHVLLHRQVREDGVVLEYHADVPFMGGQVVDGLVVKADLAAVHRIETGDHAQQGGFAAAGGAQQGEEFPGADGQVDAVQRLKVAITFDGVLDGDSMAHVDIPLS